MNKIFFFTVFFLTTISSCSIKNKATNYNFKSPKNLKEAALIINKNIQPEWVTLRGQIKIENELEEIKLNVNIKNKKDSLIWASIYLPIGIELGRVNITKDSIYIINRVEKTFTSRKISFIEKYFATKISFSELNNILLGMVKIDNNLIDFKKVEDEYSVSTEKGIYNLSINKGNISSIKFTNILNDRIFCFFSEHKRVQDNIFPFKIQLKIESTDNFEATLNYLNIKLEKPKKLVFNIPEGYVRNE